MFKILNKPSYNGHPTFGCTPSVQTFDLYGEHVALDPNSLCAVQCDSELAGRILSFAGKLKCDNGASSHNPLARDLSLYSERKPIFRLHLDLRLRKLVLNLTHNCNLRCHYCFVADKAPSVMSLDTIDAALDMFDFRWMGYQADMSFSGGEPLLAWEQLKTAVEHAQTKSSTRPRFHVTTNGTLLDHLKASFLAANGFSIILSIDGPEDIHDAARPTASGGGSWRAAMDGLSALRAAGLGERTTLRATYDTEKPRLVERLEFLNKLCDEGYAAGVSVEPAQLSEGCAARRDKTGLSEKSDLPAEYHEAAKWYLSRRPRARFFHFDKMLDRLRYRKHACSECGGGRGYITVGPQGDLFACHREGPTRIGHVRTGIDESLRAAWLDNRYYVRRECRECWARNICGGGCRQAHIEATGTPFRPDLFTCAFKKMLIKECLWILTQEPTES